LFSSNCCTQLAAQESQLTKEDMLAKWKILESMDLAPSSYSVREQLKIATVTGDSTWRVNRGIGSGVLSKGSLVDSVWNPDYSFIASRSDVGSAYRLAGLEKGKPDYSNTVYMVAVKNGNQGNILMPRTFLLADTISNLVENNSLTIDKISLSKEGNTNISGRLSFVNTADKTVEYQTKLSCEPSSGKMLSLLLSANRQGGLFEVRFVYSYRMVDGVEVVERIVNTCNNGDRFQLDFSDYLVQEPDSAMFRLSHYGLPEVEGLESKSPGFKNALLLALSGGVFLVVALTAGFMLWRRRATRTNK
jgi:hypothetical protein